MMGVEKKKRTLSSPPVRGRGSNERGGAGQIGPDQGKMEGNEPGLRGEGGWEASVLLVEAVKLHDR